jgi:hypothetical protein
MRDGVGEWGPQCAGADHLQLTNPDWPSCFSAVALVNGRESVETRSVQQPGIWISTAQTPRLGHLSSVSCGGAR